MALPPIDRKRSPVWLWLLWAVWVLFLAQPVWTLLQAPPARARLVAALGGLAVFTGLYLALAWESAARLTSQPALPEPTRRDWLATGGLASLGLAVALLGTVNGTTLFEPLIFTSALAASRLPLRWAAPAVLLLNALAALGALAGGIGGRELVGALAFITAVGAVVGLLVRAVAAEGELRVARGEISRLAAEAERLRLARDLHDLLGHNLSLITLKSELAGRLVRAAPERAAAEIDDVERVARGTLQQVREALAGYRQPALADELRDAQEMLAAAGITYQFEGEAHGLASLPTTIESLLAWTVREGATNVIRHSRAKRCTIRLARELAGVRLQVIDEGDPEARRPAQTEAQPGSGLRGLAERATALGGACQAEPAPGGFRLEVWAPLGETEGPA